MSNLFDLTGRSAAITGASRGLGKEMASALAEAGADLVISSRTEADIAAAAEEQSSVSENINQNAYSVNSGDGKGALFVGRYGAN